MVIDMCVGRENGCSLVGCLPRGEVPFSFSFLPFSTSSLLSILVYFRNRSVAPTILSYFFEKKNHSSIIIDDV